MSAGLLDRRAGANEYQIMITWIRKKLGLAAEPDSGLSSQEFRTRVRDLASESNVPAAELWRRYRRHELDGTLIEMDLERLAFQRYGLRPQPSEWDEDTGAHLRPEA